MWHTIYFVEKKQRVLIWGKTVSKVKPSSASLKAAPKKKSQANKKKKKKKKKKRKKKKKKKKKNKQTNAKTENAYSLTLWQKIWKMKCLLF